MTQDPSQILRDHLLELLRGGSAHVGFEEILTELPPRLRGVTPEGAGHSAWQLLEHLRITQRDILEFSRDEDYVTPKWPDSYWPQTEGPPDDLSWHRSVENFRRDLQAMIELVADPATDLYARIPWGDGQTILREALLVADHNSHHLGQMILLRRLLGSWPPEG